ncbi:hypothetical protein DFH08DRAFT_902990 [Mycena albidolilacea]|uniref:Uncharacterized protein n=1 Tax=Mycena albidolilacea TaxID=1033008 RepID=A0AAD6Z278_9AGAR|nr:hypothetical protein DFH08DRAFT_902990 [Mycena albidolilacea]
MSVAGAVSSTSTRSTRFRFWPGIHPPAIFCSRLRARERCTRSLPSARIRAAFIRIAFVSRKRVSSARSANSRLSRSSLTAFSAAVSTLKNDVILGLVQPDFCGATSTTAGRDGDRSLLESERGSTSLLSTSSRPGIPLATDSISESVSSSSSEHDTSISPGMSSL